MELTTTFPNPASIQPPATTTITANSLLCHKHVDMAITCLGSFARYSAQPMNLILHDDGSLTDEDEARLLASLPQSKVLRRKQSDAIMAEALARFPASAAFRKNNLFALKLLDTIHNNPAETFFYCDSDVLFFRPFTGIASFPKDFNALFMGDGQSRR